MTWIWDLISCQCCWALSWVSLLIMDKEEDEENTSWSHMPCDVQLNFFSAFDPLQDCCSVGETGAPKGHAHRHGHADCTQKSAQDLLLLPCTEITTVPPCCYRNMKAPFLCDGISAQRRMDWNPLPAPHVKINKQANKQTHKIDTSVHLMLVRNVKKSQCQKVNNFCLILGHPMMFNSCKRFFFICVYCYWESDFRKKCPKYNISD